MRRYPPLSPLRVGMKATYQGKEFTASGRQVMRQVEEGVNYDWEEWVLVAPDGDVAYLEFDEGKWKLSRPCVPNSRPGLKELECCTVGSPYPVKGAGALVTAVGKYRAVHSEGEFPFDVNSREVRYVDAAHLKHFYSAEWTGNEIEFYQGQFIDARQVLTMFSLYRELQALDQRELELRSRRWFGALCLGLSFAMLILWMVSLGSGSIASNGVHHAPLSAAVGNGARFGPIPLKSAGRVHRLEIAGSMQQESHWVQAIVEDEQQLELFAAERDMWDETGYDSDGAWHESDLHASRDFVIHKPGNYYVHLYAEPDTRPITGSFASATVQVKERVLHTTYLAIYGILAGILGLGFLIAGSPTTVSAKSSD